MRTTIGGQEFVTASPGLSISVNIHPRNFEEFDAGMKQLLALDDEEFGGHEVIHIGEMGWVSRTARDDSADVTVFGFDDFGYDEILEYMAKERTS